MNEEDREYQIEQIVRKLPELKDGHILDIADNVYWGAMKFYNPTREVVISAEVFERIQKSHPELLI